MNNVYVMSWQKGVDCLTDAIELLELGYLEAATNRAYYAVFHSLQTLLMTVDVYPKTHQGIHAKFSEHFIKTNLLPTNIGKLSMSCFEKRQFGDYELEEVTYNIASSAVNDAQQVVKGCLEYIAPYLDK